LSAHPPEKNSLPKGHGLWGLAAKAHADQGKKKRDGVKGRRPHTRKKKRGKKKNWQHLGPFNNGGKPKKTRGDRRGDMGQRERTKKKPNGIKERGRTNPSGTLKKLGNKNGIVWGKRPCVKKAKAVWRPSRNTKKALHVERDWDNCQLSR